MNRSLRKAVRRVVIAVPLLAVACYFVPMVAAIWIGSGLIDVLRNRPRNWALFQRYFFSNGILTWFLAPYNLLVDLCCKYNPGIYSLDDFPPAYRKEIDDVLGVFQSRREEIMAEIDSQFEAGRRGMYVYRWYGKPFIDSVPEFNREFKYLKTIAVSVFSGRESTSFHFGPLRLSLRILYNLKPAQSDQVFLECNGVKHYWYKDPLYIFDDTLMHRSVNEHDARRYCVFMDVIRPSIVPGLISAELSIVSFCIDRINAIFYKNWKMIRAHAPKASAPDHEPKASAPDHEPKASAPDSDKTVAHAFGS